MKQLFLTCIFAIACLGTAFAKDKVINNPVYEFSNSGITHISKIELGKTETRLYVHTIFIPHWWVKFPHTTYIEDCATGKRWQATGIINGEFDKEIYMPDSGDSTFVLIFPPLDKAVKKINFSRNEEGDIDVLAGISLDPKAQPHVAGEMPDSVSRWIDGELAKARQQTLMDLEAGEFFAQDTARLIGYIKGYDPRAGFSTGIIYISNLITGEDYPTVVRILEDGRFECAIPVNHPVCLQVNFQQAWIDFYIQPGQTLAMLLNWEEFLKADRQRNIRYEFRDIQFRGGTIASLNRELKSFNNLLPGLNQRKFYEEMKNKTPGEFQTFYDVFISDYAGAYHWLLENRNLSGDAKAILKNNYKIQNAMFLLDYEDHYTYKHRDERLPVSFYDFLQDIPMNDKMLLSAPDFSTFINRLEFCRPLNEADRLIHKSMSPEKTFTQYLFEELNLPKTPEDEAYLLMADSLQIIFNLPDITEEQRKEWFDKYNSDSDLFNERHGKKHLEAYQKKYIEIIKYLSQEEFLIEEWRMKDSIYMHELRLQPGMVSDLMKIHSLSWIFKQSLKEKKESAIHILNTLTKDMKEPFLHYEVDRLFQKHFPDEQKTAYRLPDTYEAGVFKEIIAPFKGKIILVDFWATSCGPCIYNIKQNKTLREKYKDSPDVAFLFITAENESPKDRYTEFVAEQELEHTYYISADQYRYLRQLFHFNGIPRYVLVDRDGNILNDHLRSHEHEQILQELLGTASSPDKATSQPGKEKTAFQTSREWKPVTDTRADVAIVYGVNGNPSDRTKPLSFEQRVQSWRDKGYTAHFMTGIAWGEYQDYFTGQWDGKWHLDEGQVTVNKDTIWHGHLIPYIVPSKNFLQYMKEQHVKRVIDAGIDAIFMEEPEFWMRGGYSDAFKREWQDYYGFPWRPQHESPENTYLANKLKYHLYYRALEDVFSYAKEYGKTKGMDVRCYVPTHSLVNYSSWQIVSPEASLASLPCVDGYIAQVWTGTSREETFYNGLRKERVFENAFLEYGSMESMTRPTGRKLFFLTDPIEDWPRDWADYKNNYQATFAAQLLYPTVADYEVMPWPDRIYEGLYKTCANCETREHIPRFYSTQMQIMINTLNDMPLSDNQINGSQGIGVLMSNSLMFQRFPDHKGYDDPQFSNFYGQTLPLLKRGVPVSTVHIENTGYPETWKDLKVLVMSYSNMKPMQAGYHANIAQWVKNGGALVYCGEDIDPYQSVMEWWNTSGNNYPAPAQHLFSQMGLPATPASGEYACGKGKVFVIREEPKNFVLRANNDRLFVETLQKAYEFADGKKLSFKNNLLLNRGNYVIAAVMDESVSTDPLRLKGLYIDLFDPELPVLPEKIVHPGEQAFLYDATKMSGSGQPAVLCGASRIYDEQVTATFYTFTAKSPANTSNVSRVYLPKKPQAVRINSASVAYDWDEKSHTCRIKFENNPEGVKVEIEWK